MFGVIRKRDVLAHPFVTVQCFGWPLFFRVLIASQHKTFLSLLAGTGALRPPAAEAAEILGRCAQLEWRARQIYESLAERFSDEAPVEQFFETLARQEHDHYEMLELCRQLASSGGWLEERFAPWQDAVPRLERQMEDVRGSLGDLDCVTDALRLVIQLEGSEINCVFRSAVAASSSEFLKTLRAFQTAEAKHIDYVCDQIPAIEPDLAGECRNLRAACLGDRNE